MGFLFPLVLAAAVSSPPVPSEYNCLHNDPWIEQIVFDHGPYSKGFSYNRGPISVPNRFHRPVVSVDTAKVVAHPDGTCMATFEVADPATHKPLLENGKPATVTLGIEFFNAPAIVRDPYTRNVTASPSVQFFKFVEIQENS